MQFLKTLAAISTAFVSSLAIGAATQNSAIAVTGNNFRLFSSANPNLVLGLPDNLVGKDNQDARLLNYDPNSVTSNMIGIQSSNGSYETKFHVRRDICLTAEGGLNAASLRDGTRMIYSLNCNNSLNLVMQGNTVRIARRPDLCLDVPGQQFVHGMGIKLFTCNGTSAQAWTLKNTSGQVIGGGQSSTQPASNSNSVGASGVRYQANGVSLNVNPIYGKINGETVASQHTTVQNDPEQLFDQIPAGNGKFIIKSKVNGKCLNSYNTSIGSVPNFWNCNAGDNDQLMNVQDGKIFHAFTGLQLNIGSATNTVVKWSDPRTSYQESGPGNPVKLLQTPAAKVVATHVMVYVITKAGDVGWKILENESYNLARYCLFEESVNGCINSAKPVVTNIGLNMLISGVLNVTKLQAQTAALLNLNGQKTHFILPDELPISWEDASRLCDKKSGKLRWSNNLKTCFVR